MESANRSKGRSQRESQDESYVHVQRSRSPDECRLDNMWSRKVQVARFLSLSLKGDLMSVVKVRGHGHLIDEIYNGDGVYLRQLCVFPS